MKLLLALMNYEEPLCTAIGLVAAVVGLFLAGKEMRRAHDHQ